MTRLAQSPDGSNRKRRKHLFVIDGAPAFLTLMQEILEDAQYDVTTTNFVPHSFDQIAALPPDALIVDLVIRQEDSWELLERLHDSVRTAGIPVLVISTNPSLLEAAQEQAARFGTHRYLVKPFGLDEFLTAIAEMTGDASAR